MNESASQDQRDALELARLNDAERGVLLLLAEGHTAKSIAKLIGLTPAAVNERLREARRKTGVGSSRELARLLKSQDIRDKKIGIAVSQCPAAPLAPSQARSRRPRTGALIMFTFGLIAAAAAVALMSQPSPSNEVDPIIGTALPSSDPAAWHAQVRSQSRDKRWAPRAEDTLRERFMRVSHLGEAGNILRVTCATSLCEVAGTIDVQEGNGGHSSPNTALNRTMGELQGKPLHDDLLRAGLQNKGATFTSTKSHPHRMAFFIYFSRVTD